MSENRIAKLERTVARIEKDIGRLRIAQGKQDVTTKREQHDADQQSEATSISGLVEGAPPNSDDPGKPAAGRKKRWMWLTRIKWKGILETVGIFAGIGYAFITYLQWCDLRSNFKIEERAWVGISEYRFGEPDKAGERGPIEFKLLNTGKTPAIDVTLGTKTGAHSNPIDWTQIPYSHKFQWDGNDIGSLPPEAPRAIRVPIYIPAPGGEDAISEVFAGQGTFYVAGSIRYRDVFSKDWRYTPYCFYVIKDATHPMICPIPLNMN